MLKFSEIFEFSKEKFRKIPILKEFEWFEWFGPSPIEPFNSGTDPSLDHLPRRDPLVVAHAEEFWARLIGYPEEEGRELRAES